MAAVIGDGDPTVIAGGDMTEDQLKVLVGLMHHINDAEHGSHIIRAAGGANTGTVMCAAAYMLAEVLAQGPSKAEGLACFLRMVDSAYDACLAAPHRHDPWPTSPAGHA